MLAAALLAAAQHRNYFTTGRLQATRASNDQKVRMGLEAVI
jgi:hypothetical protein